MTEEKKVKYVCKHCKVEVISPQNPRPVLGRAHKIHCPRRKMYG